MSRIPAVDPMTASGRTKELLDEVEQTFGSTPNLFRTAAASQTALESMPACSRTSAGEASTRVSASRSRSPSRR